ncbi:MAG: hydrogenase maturation protease [Desulfobulbus sp.]|nr:hydrogenase maturation protease [Desulfobulbus sp.]
MQWHNVKIMHISHNRQTRVTSPPVVIFGCGNLLLGDDGFGPAVIEQLARSSLPETIRLIDAGTGIREYLLDYLLAPAQRPDLLIVVDADPGQGAAVGQVRVCTPADLPPRKIHDFSLHQFPTVNLLRELAQATDIEIVLLLAGIDPPGALCTQELSLPVRIAVDEACVRITEIIAPFAALEGTAP